MLGNVWEWCEDHWHDSYNGAPDDGKAWVDPVKGEDKSHRLRVVRGGSWSDYARDCRAACRFRDWPGGRDGVGFRLVLAPRVQGDSRPSP